MKAVSLDDIPPDRTAQLKGWADGVEEGNCVKESGQERTKAFNRITRMMYGNPTGVTLRRGVGSIKNKRDRSK